MFPSIPYNAPQSRDSSRQHMRPGFLPSDPRGPPQFNGGHARVPMSTGYPFNAQFPSANSFPRAGHPTPHFPPHIGPPNLRIIGSPPPPANGVHYGPVGPSTLAMAAGPPAFQGAHNPHFTPLPGYYNAPHGHVVLSSKQTAIMDLHNELLRRGNHAIDYIDTVEGPQNRPLWQSIVLVDQVEYGRGIGATKKEARHEASKSALRHLPPFP